MVLNDFSQMFLFTFRANGQAHGEALVEASVEQLAGYDPSTAEHAYRRAWFGSETALTAMLDVLGFTSFDIQGVLAALHSHRDADRRLAVTPDQLQSAGFRDWSTGACDMSPRKEGSGARQSLPSFDFCLHNSFPGKCARPALF